MSETKKVFKFWWPWQTEKIENMLEENAAQGWMLIYARYAFMSFVFEKREPARVRFCLDFQEKEKPEYLALLGDDGWKMEQHASGWYIWSKAYDGEKPELFTDIDSLIHRNKMILWTLVSIFAAQIPLLIVNLQNVDVKSPIALGFMIFYFPLIAVMAGMLIGMALGIGQMKRRRRRSLKK